MVQMHVSSDLNAAEGRDREAEAVPLAFVWTRVVAAGFSRIEPGLQDYLVSEEGRNEA
jgi:hypothetical protein